MNLHDLCKLHYIGSGSHDGKRWLKILSEVAQKYGKHGSIVWPYSKGDPTKNSVTNAIGKYTSKAIYDLITDIDNINKHLGTISPDTTLILNDGSFEVEVPQFNKDGRSHGDIELEKALEDAYELLIDFYNEITNEVINCLL